MISIGNVKLLNPLEGRKDLEGAQCDSKRTAEQNPKSSGKRT
jgi:hypothetical protein